MIREKRTRRIECDLEEVAFAPSLPLSHRFRLIREGKDNGGIADDFDLYMIIVFDEDQKWCAPTS